MTRRHFGPLAPRLFSYVTIISGGCSSSVFATLQRQNSLQPPLSVLSSGPGGLSAVAAAAAAAAAGAAAATAAAASGSSGTGPGLAGDGTGGIIVVPPIYPPVGGCDAEGGCGFYGNSKAECCEDDQCSWHDYTDCANIADEEECCAAADKCAWFAAQDMLCAGIANEKACCATKGCAYYLYTMAALDQIESILAGDANASDAPGAPPPHGACWPIEAPAPPGSSGVDSCCEAIVDTCESVSRKCSCFKDCEVKVKGSIQFAHDCPGGEKCDRAGKQKAG